LSAVLRCEFSAAGAHALNWLPQFDSRLFIANVGIALSILVAIVVWPRSLRSPGARSFAWWLALGAVTNIVASSLGRSGVNNHEIFLWYRLVAVLLLGLTGYQMLPDQSRRRFVVAVTITYVAAWLVLIVSGVESRTALSQFTSPGEKLVGVIIGILLVAESIRSSDASPLHHAASWLGIGLVLSSATGLAVFPIMAELVRRSPTDSTAMLLRQISSVINDVALVLWCIPYWKRGVTWTR
jgi:multisubunit Na+/H+ antiporter MnhC subunit